MIPVGDYKAPDSKWQYNWDVIHSALSNEQIKIICLHFSVNAGAVEPIQLAKEMYEWVKDDWIVISKEASEITIAKDGKTITIPLQEFEVK
jgi:hypothetical protein